MDKKGLHALVGRIEKPKEYCEPSITIRVDVDEKDNLLSPIFIDDEKITSAGLYLINGIRYWVVVGDSKPPQPDEIEEIKKGTICLGNCETGKIIKYIFTENEVETIYNIENKLNELIRAFNRERRER